MRSESYNAAFQTLERGQLLRERERERAVVRLSVFSTIMTEMADFVPSKTEFITKAWILTVINKVRNERQQSLLR